MLKGQKPAWRNLCGLFKYLHKIFTITIDIGYTL
nr:MAG TPA: hypothetical protein [Bacteriophage sp.]DAV48406.1 MAG TPA: hypothetical protein [Caudoviricetes sp.]